jgi:hypothetical protein
MLCQCITSNCSHHCYKVVLSIRRVGQNMDTTQVQLSSCLVCLDGRSEWIVPTVVFHNGKLPFPTSHWSISRFTAALMILNESRSIMLSQSEMVLSQKCDNSTGCLTRTLISWTCWSSVNLLLLPSPCVGSIQFASPLCVTVLGSNWHSYLQWSYGTLLDFHLHYQILFLLHSGKWQTYGCSLPVLIAKCWYFLGVYMWNKQLGFEPHSASTIHPTTCLLEALGHILSYYFCLVQTSPL